MLVNAPSTAPDARARAPVDAPGPDGGPAFDEQLELQLLRGRAGERVDEVVDAFMATVFFYPLLEQMGDSPFRSARFDGGFAESSFQGRLHERLADAIAASPRVGVGGVIRQRLDQWVQRQSAERLRELTGSTGVDVHG